MHSKEVIQKYFKLNIKTKRRRASRRELEWGLNVEYLVNLYLKQEGKCFYTGVDLSIQEGINNNKLTIERLDPLKGYTEGNVVLVSYQANCAKSSLDVFIHSGFSEEMKMSLLGRAFAHISNKKRAREKQRKKTLDYFSSKLKRKRDVCNQQNSLSC